MVDTETVDIRYSLWPVT